MTASFALFEVLESGLKFNKYSSFEFLTNFVKKDCFLRAVLGLQLNEEEGTKILYNLPRHQLPHMHTLPHY